MLRASIYSDYIVVITEHISCRATIHPILNRLGVDLLVGRITHLRDDDRFKAIGPDTLVLAYPNQSNTLKPVSNDAEKEAEIWFDWAFVDFWKSNYCACGLLGNC